MRVSICVLRKVLKGFLKCISCSNPSAAIIFNWNMYIYCSWWFILPTRLYVIYISIYMPRFFIWLYLSEERVFRNTFVDFRKKYSMNSIDRDEFTTKLSKSGRFTLDAKFYRKPEIFSVWFRLILAMKQRWLDGKKSYFNIKYWNLF